MPHRKASIYITMYSIALLVLLAFFGHNALEHSNYDVLHIEETFNVRGKLIHIHDIFPFFDAPSEGHYGEVPRLDIQIYVYRLSQKLILFASWVALYRMCIAFNILAADIPGRSFNRLPYIILVIVGLFGYDLLNFLFFASQGVWIYEALGVVVALGIVVATKKEKLHA